MKISYASAMTKVKLNGNAPTSYAPSAKAKVTLFGSTTMHKPWWSRKMKSKLQVKSLHVKMEEYKAKPMMESIRAPLSTIL